MKRNRHNIFKFKNMYVLYYIYFITSVTDWVKLPKNVKVSLNKKIKNIKSMLCAICVAYFQGVKAKSVHLIYFLNNFYTNYAFYTFSIIWELILKVFTTNEQC